MLQEEAPKPPWTQKNILQQHSVKGRFFGGRNKIGRDIGKATPKTTNSPPSHLPQTRESGAIHIVWWKNTSSKISEKLLKISPPSKKKLHCTSHQKSEKLEKKERKT